MNPATLSLPSVPLPAVGTLAIVAVIFVSVLRRWRSRSPPFPPGPRPDPLIGNIRQMGSKDLKVLFEEWGKEYGVLSLREWF